MLTKSAALELADADIRVNAISPGHTAIEFMHGLIEKHLEMAAEEGFIEPIPMGVAASPDDHADVALFLVSEESDYVTVKFFE
jgi:3alpha(or 20beta)-hydroxysteroid dehydrogenase